MSPLPPVTALIPIKHHSERVSGKNLRSLCKKPLLYWTLAALRDARHVGSIVVDTDSDEVTAFVKENFDATVLRRPERLCGDMVTINPLLEFELSKTPGEHFLQTHVTNPLLRPATIDAAVEAFFAHPDHDSLCSVTRVQTRLYWEDGRPINHDPKNLVRTQDLPVVWWENSCLYVFSRESFRANGHRMGRRPLFFPIPTLEAVDIDEEEDFTMAEALMERRLGREAR